jgi:hypothetical protein
VCRESRTDKNDFDSLGLASHIALRHSEVEVIASIGHLCRHADRFGTMLVVVVGVESLNAMLKFAESNRRSNTYLNTVLSRILETLVRTDVICERLVQRSAVLHVKNLPALGLLPLTKTEPSGRIVATEWYMRGILDSERPSDTNREPAGRSGS